MFEGRHHPITDGGLPHCTNVVYRLNRAINLLCQIKFSCLVNKDDLIYFTRILSDVA